MMRIRIGAVQQLISCPQRPPANGTVGRLPARTDRATKIPVVAPPREPPATSLLHHGGAASSVVAAAAHEAELLAVVVRAGTKQETGRIGAAAEVPRYLLWPGTGNRAIRRARRVTL